MPDRDQPAPVAILLLDELRPLVQAVHLTENVQRQDTSGNGRSGRHAPAPINDSIVSAQHDARRSLGGLVARLRGALDLNVMDSDVSRLLGLPCPHCHQSTLRFRVATEEVYCADVGCHDEAGQPYAWPKEWLSQLGRLAGEDDEQPLTIAERLRARIEELEARCLRLEADNTRLRDQHIHGVVQSSRTHAPEDNQVSSAA